MKIESIKHNGLIDLFDMMISLKNVKSRDETSSYDDETMINVFGAKQEMMMNNIQVIIKVKEATFFDIEILNRICDSILIQSIAHRTLPFSHEDETNVLNNLMVSHPDLHEYIKKNIALTVNLLNNESETIRENAFCISPIGCIYTNCTCVLSGMNVITLFNGFVDNFVFKNFKSIEELHEKIHFIEDTIYKNFLMKFCSTFSGYYERKAFTVDYLNRYNYFRFIPKTNENYFAIESIRSSNHTIHMLGEKIKVENVMKEISEYKMDYNESTEVFYYVCDFDIISFLLIKILFNHKYSPFKIICHESIDDLYSQTDLNLNTNLSEYLNEYAVRVSTILSKNIEMRRICSLDKSKLNLSSVLNRYGLILVSQKIKFLMRVDLKIDMIESFESKGIKDSKFYINLIDILTKMIDTSKMIKSKFLT